MIGSNEEQRRKHNTCGKFYGYGSGALVAQCFATFVVGLTYAANGIMAVAPTIVLGNILNSKHDVLSLNEEQASWFGSIPSLLQPVGNFMGILLLDFFGQRYGLLLSNMLGVVFFLTLHFATATSTVLLSSIAVGLGLGLMAPSGMGYMSEYSEPRFRGLLGFGTTFMQNFGILSFSYVASVVDWRTLLLIHAIIPLISILLLFLIPDSPIWLICRGRKKEALKALSWFRGWVRNEDVQEELVDLENYVKVSLTHKRTTDAEQTALLDEPSQGNQSNLSGLLSSILERRTLYPLFFVIFFKLIIFMAEAVGTTTYALNFYDSLHLPINSYFLMFIALFGRMVGSLIFMVVLKFTGKRSVSLTAVFLLASTTICFGIFVHFNDELRQMPWIFAALLLFRGFGASQLEITSLISGELLPVRTRHAGSGLHGTFSSILQFFFVKTYFTTVRVLGMDCYLLMSGVIGMVGCLYLYFFLPETERKSLLEIEDIFLKTPATNNAMRQK